MFLGGILLKVGGGVFQCISDLDCYQFNLLNAITHIDAESLEFTIWNSTYLILFRSTNGSLVTLRSPS